MRWTPPDQASTWDIMNPFIFHWTFTITTNEISTPLKIKMVHLSITQFFNPKNHLIFKPPWLWLQNVNVINFQGRTPLFKIIPFSPCKFRMKFEQNICASETFSQTWRFEDKVPQRRWSSWAQKTTRSSQGYPVTLKLTDSTVAPVRRPWETHLSLSSVFQVRTDSFREGN